MRLSSPLLVTKLLYRKPHPYLFAILLLSLHLLLGLSILGYTRSLTRVYESIIDIRDGVVISSFAISPFTATLDSRELENIIGDIDGLEIEYHMVTFAFLDREILFIKSTDLPGDCIALSKDIASRLSVNIGDILPLYSIFTNRVVFLRVCSIVDSVYSLVNYQKCIEIRGVRPGVYSFAIVRSRDPDALRRLYERLEIRGLNERVLTRGLILLQRFGNRQYTKIYGDLSIAYLDRMGLHRDLIVYLGYGLLTALLICTPIVGIGLMLFYRKEITVLLRLGLSRRSILLMVNFILLLSLLISSILVHVIFHLGYYPRLEILVFELKPIITTWDYLLLNIVSLILAVLGTIYESKSILEW